MARMPSSPMNGPGLGSSAVTLAGDFLGTVHSRAWVYYQTEF